MKSQAYYYWRIGDDGATSIDDNCYFNSAEAAAEAGNQFRDQKISQDNVNAPEIQIVMVSETVVSVPA